MLEDTRKEHNKSEQDDKTSMILRELEHSVVVYVVASTDHAEKKINQKRERRGGERNPPLTG